MTKFLPTIALTLLAAAFLLSTYISQQRIDRLQGRVDAIPEPVVPLDQDVLLKRIATLEEQVRSQKPRPASAEIGMEIGYITWRGYSEAQAAERRRLANNDVALGKWIDAQREKYPKILEFSLLQYVDMYPSRPKNIEQDVKDKLTPGYIRNWYPEILNVQCFGIAIQMTYATDNPKQIGNFLAITCPPSTGEIETHIAHFLSAQADWTFAKGVDEYRKVVAGNPGDARSRVEKWLRDVVKLPDGLETVKQWYRDTKKVDADFLFKYHGLCRGTFFDAKGKLIRYPAVLMPTNRGGYEYTFEEDSAPMHYLMCVAKPFTHEDK
jgi:hypothetical protein